MQSGIATRKDKGKRPKENVWVHKAIDKEIRFGVNKVKEMFMEEKRSFTDEGDSTSRTQNTGKFEDTNTT